MLVYTKNTTYLIGKNILSTYQNTLWTYTTKMNVFFMDTLAQTLVTKCRVFAVQVHFLQG